MQSDNLKELLKQVQTGSLDIETAFDKLKGLPFESLEFAHIDHHRALRRGFPEVIFGLGKTDAQIATIADRILASNANLLATRSTQAAYDLIKKDYPETKFDERSGTIYTQRDMTDRGTGTILVISAGTSDIPVAEEAAITATVMGNKVDKIFDVGVAGIHRLLAHREAINHANVIIVVAGMEGALPSVVGGLCDTPVIAVPTSIGYGASFGGVTALLGMLTSCAAGVSVVNIDNGFGAGYMAALINRKEKNR